MKTIITAIILAIMLTACTRSAPQLEQPQQITLYTVDACENAGPTFVVTPECSGDINTFCDGFTVVKGFVIADGELYPVIDVERTW